MSFGWLMPAAGKIRDHLDDGMRVHPLLDAANPRLLQAVLDVGMMTTIGLAYLQVGHPDLLFHVVWVFLAFNAFAFGLRSTINRIGLATASLIAYAFLNAQHLLANELELIEWPLMFIIAVLVAVMADNVRSTSQRYARLYRLAQDRLLTAQEAERHRLALDLHDGVGQTLSALALTLEVADRAAPGSVRRAQAVRRGRELAASATEETRAVAQRLRPARIERIGLASAVRELARGSGLPARVRVDRSFAAADMAPEVAVGVYRIVQEAFANIARHADAKSVVVTIAQHRGTLLVNVRDDGQGFTVDQSSDRGLGLAGMADRAALLGGEVEIRSAVGHGTTVTIQVPIAPGRSARAADFTSADLVQLEGA